MISYNSRGFLVSTSVGHNVVGSMLVTIFACGLLKWFFRVQTLSPTILPPIDLVQNGHQIAEISDQNQIPLLRRLICVGVEKCYHQI